MLWYVPEKLISSETHTDTPERLKFSAHVASAVRFDVIFFLLNPKDGDETIILEDHSWVSIQGKSPCLQHLHTLALDGKRISYLSFSFFFPTRAHPAPQTHHSTRLPLSSWYRRRHQNHLDESRSLLGMAKISVFVSSLCVHGLSTVLSKGSALQLASKAFRKLPRLNHQNRQSTEELPPKESIYKTETVERSVKSNAREKAEFCVLWRLWSAFFVI